MTERDFPVLTDVSVAELARSMSISLIEDVSQLPMGAQLIADYEIRNLCISDQRFAILDTGECVLGEYNEEVREKLANIVTPKLIDRGLATTILPAKLTIVENLIVTAKQIPIGVDGAVIRKSREPAQRQLDAIIATALDAGASDIHFHIMKRSAAVDFRINRGVKRIEHNLDRERVLDMVRAAFNYTATMEGGQAMGGYKTRVVNDGSIIIQVEGRGIVPVRLSSLPNKNGASVILRLLTSSERLLTLGELGYLPEQQAIYHDTANLPFGGVITAGPTGSGKSTTVAAALRLVNPDRRVITFEDPIEHDLPNASQVPVNPKIPETSWEVLLEASLRQDPDVMFFSELRSQAVAKLFARASSSGHLVYATLHANTATQIPRVLKDMGLPISTLSDETFLRVIGSQRLIKRLCPNCKIPLDRSQHIAYDLGRMKRFFGEDYDKLRTVNPKGCKTCGGTGLKGVGMVAEVIRLDTEDRRYIATDDYNGWRQALVKKGWVDMREHARQKILGGDYCPFLTELEIAAYFGDNERSDAFHYGEYRASLIEKRG